MHVSLYRPECITVHCVIQMDYNKLVNSATECSGVKHNTVSRAFEKNDIMPVLELNSGFMVKYSPSNLKAALGFVLGSFLSCRAIFDGISLALS